MRLIDSEPLVEYFEGLARSIANVEDCELVESHYTHRPQEENVIRSLMAHGMESYVDARSAMLYGIL